MKKMRKIGGGANENTGRNGQAKGTQNHFTTPRSSYEVIRSIIFFYLAYKILVKISIVVELIILFLSTHREAELMPLKKIIKSI